MSAELVAIGVFGVALGIVMFATLRGLRADIRAEIGSLRMALRGGVRETRGSLEDGGLRKDMRGLGNEIRDLRAQVAGLEGLVQGLALRGFFLRTARRGQPTA